MNCYAKKRYNKTVAEYKKQERNEVLAMYGAIILGVVSIVLTIVL